jgi:cyanophycinase
MRGLWFVIGAVALVFACQSNPHEMRWSDLFGGSSSKGTLFIIGGGSRPLSLMEGVARRLPNPDALVLVMPMASSQPDTSMKYGMRPLVELGLTNVKPMHVSAEKVTDAQLDSIRTAAGFYLCGGDQARFMAAVDDRIIGAIQTAYQNGAVVSGSSAGAAMMSQVMITGDQLREPEYESTYRRIKTDNGVYGEGLGLMPHAIIDQHFVERSRYNRALTALHDFPGLPVIGIGESTALVVEPNAVTVEGESQVVVFWPAETRSDTAGRIGIAELQMDVLLPGDRIDW